VERRRAARLGSDGILGYFRVVEDVELKRVGSKSITIVTGIRIPLGERMVLRSVKNGAWTNLAVRAVKRRAGIITGRLRHDVILQVDGAWRRRRNTPGRNATVDVDRKKSGHARVAALVRDIPVRLVDLSVSGCLLEGPEYIDEGKVGSLETVIDGQRCSEVVRTSRSFRMEGRVWPWTTDAQFLTLSPPSAASLRRVALKRGVEGTEWRPTVDRS
jgi:hypothetical protein